MPKVDINAAYKSQGMNPAERKKTAKSATNAILSGGLILMDEQPNIPIQEIPLYKIHLRAVNNFHSVDNLELDESIRMYGLINPIAVCHHIGEDEYIISAGERRYKSIVRLHERYPDNPRFQKIECKVYILTDDKTLLENGFPYITEEQEEGIYRDSNLQSRQLTEEDIAGQIRHIVDRFSDEDYVLMLRRTAEQSGIATYSNPDRTKLIGSVLKTQNMWSREKIRQYLVIYDLKREDMLDSIERGELKVGACYKQIVEEQKRKRKRKTNKLPIIIKSIEQFKTESEDRIYTAKDLADIQECIDILNEIISSYKTE